VKTAVLLTDQERAEFGKWLGLRLEQCGLSKKRFSQRLSGSNVETANISTLNANRYLKGMIPVPTTLARIARIVDVPWPVVLWRAGCFREVLGVIDLVSQIDEVADLAIDLALTMFPRRDVAPPSMDLVDVLAFSGIIQEIADPEHEPPQTKEFFDNLTRHLDPALQRASTVLADKVFSAAQRREVAAEIVNAWADARNLNYANETRERIRQHYRRQIEDLRWGIKSEASAAECEA